MYIIVELLCYTSATNIIYVKHISIYKERKKETDSEDGCAVPTMVYNTAIPKKQGSLLEPIVTFLFIILPALYTDFVTTIRIYFLPNSVLQNP